MRSLILHHPQLLRVEYGFEAHAESRGLSAEAALKLTKSSSLAKILENMASNAMEVE